MSGDEETLVRRSQAGDRQAFEQLVSRYERKVYNLAYRLMGNADDAYDAAQEAFLKVYLSLGDFRGQSAFGTWLHRIVANVCLDEIRRRRRQPVSSLEELPPGSNGGAQRQLADPGGGPQEAVERGERVAMIQEGLNALEPEYRLAVILRDVQGHSYEEIARILDCSLGTVKSRLNRGRQALKEKLVSRELFGPKFVKLVERGESR